MIFHPAGGDLPDSPDVDITTPGNTEKLLHAARQGDLAALGSLLQAYLPYLLVIARQAFDPALTGKVSPSDLVQETLLEAHRDFESFQSGEHDDLKRWLRRLLINNLEDCRRLFTATDKRNVYREQSLHALTPKERAKYPFVLDPTAPLEKMIQGEQTVMLEKALARLSEETRRIIYYRHQLRLSFPSIGSRLGRAENAVRMQYARALEKLRRDIEGQENAGQR